MKMTLVLTALMICIFIGSNNVMADAPRVNTVSPVVSPVPPSVPVPETPTPSPCCKVKPCTSVGSNAGSGYSTSVRKPPRPSLRFISRSLRGR